MFDKLIFKFKLKQLCSSWNGTPANLSIGETLAAETLLLIEGHPKTSVIFSSNYVEADAAVLAYFYFDKILTIKELPYSDIQKLRNAFKMGASHLFKISPSELDQMLKNRQSTFLELMGNSMATAFTGGFIEEAGYLFAQDLYYNKFVEFSNDSPLIIMDINRQMQIEAETKSFFRVVVQTSSQIISEYLS